MQPPTRPPLGSDERQEAQEASDFFKKLLYPYEITAAQAKNPGERRTHFLLERLISSTEELRDLKRFEVGCHFSGIRPHANHCSSACLRWMNRTERLRVLRSEGFGYVPNQGRGWGGGGESQVYICPLSYRKTFSSPLLLRCSDEGRCRWDSFEFSIQPSILFLFHKIKTHTSLPPPPRFLLSPLALSSYPSPPPRKTGI